MLNLIHDNQLVVTLDVSGAEDHVPSVAFDIAITWNMPYQKVRIDNKECWFSCEAFDAFVSSLIQMANSDSGTASFHDLSEKPIFEFSKNKSKLNTRIWARDTVGIGEISLSVAGYSSELSEIIQALRDFEKWW